MGLVLVHSFHKYYAELFFHPDYEKKYKAGQWVCNQLNSVNYSEKSKHLANLTESEREIPHITRIKYVCYKDFQFYKSLGDCIWVNEFIMQTNQFIDELSCCTSGRYYVHHTRFYNMRS